MIRDLQVMITKHRRTFTLANKEQPHKVVINRQSEPDAHRGRLSKMLPHYAALQPKLPLRHTGGQQAV